jgi:hypothetical protein
MGSRGMAMLIGILGVAVLVFGAIFIVRAGSGEQQIANEIQPLKLEEVNAKYDAVKAKQIEIAKAEEPQIQAGKAAPSAMYNYLSVQKSLLGVVKVNIALAGAVRMVGIMSVLAGLALLFAGVGLFRKNRAG